MPTNIAQAADDREQDGQGAPLARARGPKAIDVHWIARWGVLAATVLAVEIVYLFFATAGTFSHWPTYTVYYDLLAEDSFVRGTFMSRYRRLPSS